MTQQKRAWREVITLPRSTLSEIDILLDKAVNHPELLAAQGVTLEQIEDSMFAARWYESPRLVFRVSSRIVRILTESFFEDVFARDIYLPPGIDVLQIVPERDDPLCKHTLMFLLPNETWANYYLVTSDGVRAARLQINPNQRVSDFSGEVVTEGLVDPTYLSLIAAIGFIADSDEYGLVRHLVLNKDSEKYERARTSGDTGTMRHLEDRARRNHKNERIVDTFSLELGEIEPASKPAAPAFTQASKRPHVRRGHFRKVRHGPGMKQVKVKWFPPIVVRKDLLGDTEEKLLRPNG